MTATSQHYAECRLQATAEVTRFRLMRPAALRAGQRLPAVLFLHGSGQRGSDNVAQLRHLPTWLAEPEARQRFPCFVIAPQCPSGASWIRGDRADLQTVTLIDVTPTAALHTALAALRQTMADEPIDPQRVYLTGISMGGFGAWGLAQHVPDLFAALAPICGGGDVRRAAALAALPVWAFHGAGDDVVPVGHSRRMIEAVRSAGGAPRYTELPGVGHASWDAAYYESGLLPWLFAQRRG
ncbi:MAG: dienelactone hydrolase family protein [Planctomycetota bacterium]